MKKKIMLAGGLLILGRALTGFAPPPWPSMAAGGSEIPPLTFFFVLNKVFPEVKEVSIFMTKEMLAENESKLNRASGTFNIKATIYVIESTASLGNAIKQISPNSVVMIFSGGIMNEKSSILYVLSKCKEKQIVLLTSSMEYSTAGALLGLVVDENQKTKLVVNLAHSENLRSKFSQESLLQQGIYAEIR
jgi:ABC-type uncharacterized transport system substrate-binding protein